MQCSIGSQGFFNDRLVRSLVLAALFGGIFFNTTQANSSDAPMTAHEPGMGAQENSAGATPQVSLTPPELPPVTNNPTGTGLPPPVPPLPPETAPATSSPPRTDLSPLRITRACHKFLEAGKSISKHRGHSDALPEGFTDSLREVGASTAAESSTENSDRDGAQTLALQFAELQRKMYGKNTGFTTLSFPGRPADVLSRTVLTNAKVAGTARIAVPLDEAIKTEDSNAEAEFLKVQKEYFDKQQILESKKITYKQSYLLILLRSLQQVVSNAENSAQSERILSSLFSLVQQDADDYMAIREAQTLLDQAEGQLYLLLFHLQRKMKWEISKEKNENLFHIFEAVHKAVYRKDVKPLDNPVSSFEKQEGSAKEPFVCTTALKDFAMANLEGDDQDAVLRLLGRVEVLSKRIEKVKARFTNSHEAASIAFFYLAAIYRTSGEGDLEYYNPLIKAFFSGRIVPEFATLRDVAIAVVENEGVYWDHANHQPIEAPNVQAAYRIFGEEEMDPLIIGGVFWHRESADALAQSFRLREMQNEIALMDALLDAKSQDERAKVMASFAQTGLQGVQQALSNVTTNPLAKSLIGKLLKGNDDMTKLVSKNAPIDAKTKRRILTPLPLPQDEEKATIVINALRNVRTAWNPEALNFLWADANARPGPADPTAPLSSRNRITQVAGLQGTTALEKLTDGFVRVLDVLDEQAGAIKEKAIAAGLKHAQWRMEKSKGLLPGNPKIDPDFQTAQKDLSTLSSQVFEGVIDALYALNIAVVQGGGNESDAQATFAWHLKMSSPDLQQLVQARAESSKLSVLRNVLTFFELSTAQGMDLDGICFTRCANPTWFGTFSWASVQDRIRASRWLTWKLGGMTAFSMGQVVGLTYYHQAIFQAFHQHPVWGWAGLAGTIGLDIIGWRWVSQAQALDDGTDNDDNAKSETPPAAPGAAMNPAPSITAINSAAVTNKAGPAMKPDDATPAVIAQPDATDKNDKPSGAAPATPDTQTPGPGDDDNKDGSPTTT